MVSKAEINEFKCLRCGHTWIPRQSRIKICPSCKSSYWDKPKQAERILEKIKRQHKQVEQEVYRAMKSTSYEAFVKAMKRRNSLEDRYWKVRTRNLPKA